MHWVIQNNFYNEKGMCDLVEYLERHGIPFSEHSGLYEANIGKIVEAIESL